MIEEMVTATIDICHVYVYFPLSDAILSLIHQELIKSQYSCTSGARMERLKGPDFLMWYRLFFLSLPPEEKKKGAQCKSILMHKLVFDFKLVILQMANFFSLLREKRCLSGISNTYRGYLKTCTDTVEGSFVHIMVLQLNTACLLQ